MESKQLLCVICSFLLISTIILLPPQTIHCGGGTVKLELDKWHGNASIVYSVHTHVKLGSDLLLQYYSTQDNLL